MAHVGRGADDFTIRWYVSSFTGIFLEAKSGTHRYSVGSSLEHPITSLLLDGDAVWTASGPNATKFLRGKQVYSSFQLLFCGSLTLADC